MQPYRVQALNVYNGNNNNNKKKQKKMRKKCDERYRKTNIEMEQTQNSQNQKKLNIKI